MEPVDQTIIDRVVSMYHPQFRYLRSLATDGTNGNAVFQLGTTGHLVDPVQHLTAVEADICRDQAGYAAFTYGVQQGWEGLPRQGIEEFLQKGRENMLVRKCITEFHRMTTPEGRFDGELHLKRRKKVGCLYLADIAFSLNAGAVGGEVRFILRCE